MSARLTLSSLTHRYPGANVDSVDDLSLEVEPGEMLALLGPSGCGKTTVLKLVAGLLEPTAGEVAVDGGSLAGVAAERRGTAMVFQKALLFGHMSVADNVAFGLRMRRLGRSEILARVTDALAQVHLEHLADRRPRQLSGGQQQRVALARTLVTEPRVLLLDEPLSALDAGLREEMRSLVRELQQKGGHTAVFVTHDQEDAVTVADRIALLVDGRLLMHNRPEDFFERPASRRVAEFFGGANFLAGWAAGGVVETSLGQLVTAGAVPDGPVELTLRPEAVRLGEGPNRVRVQVAEVDYRGTRLVCRLRAAGDVELRADLPPDEGIAAGDDLLVHLPPAALWPLRGDRG